MKLLLVAAFCCGAVPVWSAPIPVSVVGADDKPVAGASVEAVAVDFSKPDQTRAPLPVKATPDGRWSVAWNGSLGAETDFSGPFALVRAQAPGWASQTARLAAGENVLHLEPSRVWSGVVLNREGQPMAGAVVEVYRWQNEGAPGTPQSRFWALQRDWTLKATTDSEGRWQIAGLPARARVFLVVSGPRVAMDGFEIEMDEGEAPPIFARAGGTITGRLVAPDGKALANVPVVWQGNGLSTSEPTRTDARGRFTLSGLAPANGSLISWDNTGIVADPGYVIPRSSGVTVRGGQTTDIGLWKAQHGVLVRGQVVDASTKKPVAGAKIELYTTSLGATSDAAGRFVARVSREEDAISGNIEAPNYAFKPITLPAFKANASALEMGTIALVRGARLDLSVRVLGGPMPGVRPPSLSLTKGDLTQGLSFNGTVGAIASPALEAGRYQISLGQAVGSDGPQWQLVSPQTIVVPAPGAPRAKIEIVLRSLQSAPAPISEVRGRIVDDQGQGIAGAIVSAALDAGTFTMNARTLSDRNGNYVFRGPYFATPVTLSVERPGYESVGEAITKFEGEVAYVSGITLKKR